MGAYIKTLISFLLLLNISATFAFEDVSVINSNFRAHLKTQENYQYLEFGGKFGYFDLKKLEDLVNNIDGKKDLIIRISNFFGGYAKGVSQFANSISSRCNQTNGCTIYTVIDDRGTCSSACALLFMIGTWRIAHEGSNFGFHTLSFGPFTSFKGASKLLQESGISPIWIEKNKDILSKKRVTHIKGKDLKNSNLVNSLSKTRLTSYKNIVEYIEVKSIF